MSDQLIGPGQKCWTCWKDYGEHTSDCPVGIQLAADRAKEERVAVVRDCDHDWKPSGFHNDVESCSRCRILRLKQE